MIGAQLNLCFEFRQGSRRRQLGVRRDRHDQNYGKKCRGKDGDSLKHALSVRAG